MWGSINGWEAVVLIAVAVIVIGPERLPTYAAQLGRLVRELRALATGAKERVQAEVGDDLDGLRSFDPRQYDPRRIIRDALVDDPPQARSASRGTPGAGPGAGPAPGAAAAGATGAMAAGSWGGSSAVARGDLPVPFDDEAT